MCFEQLECDFCHTRQHLTCYGFLHPNDEKIPVTHACYACLLGSDESKVFRQIETLVLLRQALKIIIEDGYPLRIKEFAQRLREHTLPYWSVYIAYSPLYRL